MSQSKNSGFAVIKVSMFRGKDSGPDKNGKMPMYLHPVAGNIPDRNVIAGTVAEDQGFKEDKTYLVQWVKDTKNIDPVYGPRFNFIPLKELDGLEMVTVISGPMFNGESGSLFNVGSTVTQSEDTSGVQEVASSNSRSKTTAQEG